MFSLESASLKLRIWHRYIQPWHSDNTESPELLNSGYKNLETILMLSNGLKLLKTYHRLPSRDSAHLISWNGRISKAIILKTWSKEKGLSPLVNPNNSTLLHSGNLISPEKLLWIYELQFIEQLLWATLRTLHKLFPLITTLLRKYHELHFM